MSIKDKHGNEIDKGSYIIYTKTGTIGEVLDTKIDETGSWALMKRGELSRLWYKSNVIELTDEKHATDLKEERNKEQSVQDIKDKMDRVKNAKMSMDDAVGGG